MKRSDIILQNYLIFLDKHINDVVQGNTPEFLKLSQIAKELFISANHLSDTIQERTGHHPCYFYDQKIIEQSKKMLIDTNLSVSEISRALSYDPSNFTKFFKKIVGYTPKTFRNINKM